MFIYIKIKSKTLELFVKPSYTIDDIKEEIKEKEGIPKIQQQLIYDAKILKNNRTLADYNISKGSKLILNTYINIEANGELMKRFETKKFIKSIPEKKKVLMESYFRCKINEHDLEMTELNDPIRQAKRKEEIKIISSKLIKQKFTKEEYLNNVTKFNQKMKESIIYDVFHTPEKFYSIEDTEKAKKHSSLFIQGVLATFLQSHNIICAIEKKNSDSQSASLTLQLIASGEAFKKKLNVCCSYGDETDANIVFDPNEKKKFIDNKKKEYSKILKVPEKDIIITDLEYGSINFWVDIRNRNLTDTQINNILATEGSRNVNLGCLICACKISPDFLMKSGIETLDGG